MLFWTGQSVSQTGTQVTILALPLAAIVILKASAFEVGLLSAADTSAYLLGALPAGMLADRLSRRRLMLWCDLGLIIVIGSVPAAQAAGVLKLGQLYAVALISSIFGVVLLVSSTSYLPTLVETDQLVDGNGKLSTTESFAQLAGPSLGALLVGLFGAALAMASDAMSYVFAATCLLVIRRREQPGAQVRHRERPGLRRQLDEGVRYVMREPILRKATAWSGTANFFVIMVETLGPVFLVRIVHLRPAYVGLLLALAATGGVTGGLVSGALSRRIGSARVVWLSMTILPLPGLLIPLAGPGWRVLLFAIGWISWTFGATVCNVSLLSYQQRTCPPAILGRVNAASRWIKWGTLPLGGITGGALAAVLGVHATLWLAVIATCLASLWLLFSPLRGMRDLPEKSLAPAI
jgi:predicted MFS family arabinose efflux permease